MKITITNITNAQLSCSLGVVAPSGVLSTVLTQQKYDLVSSELLSLESKGQIRLTIVADGGEQRSTQTVTTKSLTLWVDQTTGKDINSGSVDSPLKTIQAAINTLPLTLEHACTIWVGPGTYDEALTLHNRLQANLTIQGTTWNVPTLASGITSGVFDASFVGQPLIQTAVVAGAGWTVNDLRGKFVYIPSMGLYLPIATNAATTIDLPLHVSATSGPGGNGGRDIRGLAFQIVTQAAILQNTLTTNPLTTVKTILLAAGGGSASGVLNLVYLQFVAAAVVLLGNIRLAAPMSTTILGCKVDCWVNGTASPQSMTIGQSFFDAPSGTSGVSLVHATTLTSSSTVFDGSKHGGGVGLGFSGSGGSWFARGIFQNLSVALSSGIGTQCGISSGATLIRNCSTGISLAIGCSLIFGNSNSLTTIDTCTTGILCSNALNGNEYGGCSLWLGTLTIQNCGTGIKMESSRNSVYVSDASSIINSTVWGVNMGYVKRSSYNQFACTSALIMSGNVSGDITLDGTTVTSIANLRAAGNKNVVDATRFNRATED